MASCSCADVRPFADEALLVNKKYHEQLQPLDLRIECTRSFLELIRPGIEHDVVPIQVSSSTLLRTKGILMPLSVVQDPYGPTANDPTIKALVVSDETRAGGDAGEQQPPYRRRFVR